MLLSYQTLLLDDNEILYFSPILGFDVYWQRSGRYFEVSRDYNYTIDLKDLCRVDHKWFARISWCCSRFKTPNHTSHKSGRCFKERLEIYLATVFLVWRDCYFDVALAS
ncbi:hypothetical protein OS493_010188 [Desmophyllum pertusum]|uniref:Uncharacterized protein n=1 Tax=Desmophyllum pertusum TaxID=174260 RepID=A0A9X0CHH1_9CNID|nr:hypothetical protein OS493_010188 [Desmophyllum pertusum]